jgi:hypothetical protein
MVARLRLDFAVVNRQCADIIAAMRETNSSNA